MAKRNAPDSTSSDYDVMEPYWTQVDTLLGGVEAVRAAGQALLPKFPNEQPADYSYRLATSKFTNVFGDILANLAAKPFSEACALTDEAPDKIKALIDNIDGKGSTLHTFAAETFYDGIARAVDWIYVEYPKPRPRTDGRPLTRADEAAQKLRPYWVRIPAVNMFAVYSDYIGGEEVFTYARWLESSTRRDGFDEVTVERIRELYRDPIEDAFGKVVGYAPARFNLWEKRTNGRGRAAKSSWDIVDEGGLTIGEIPLTPFATGRRVGRSWRFVPPMRDAAELQVKLYQAETALWSIKELTAFPMLAGNGVQPKMVDGKPEPVPVGPRAVLYAPPLQGQNSATHGNWAYIEPGAQSLKFLSEEVDKLEKQLRELGRQPLIGSQMTVIQAGMNSQKANSAIQAWALNLKDALERALALTAKWLMIDARPEVKIHTDFALDVGDDKGPDWLRDMAKRNRLSTETEWAEAKRRNVLSDEFDPEAERDRIEKETPDPDELDDMAGALGGAGAGQARRPQPRRPDA